MKLFLSVYKLFVAESRQVVRMGIKQKSRIEMRPLLRIFRFCNPQRKLRKPSTNVYLLGAGFKRGLGLYYFVAGIISVFISFSLLSTGAKR